MSSLSTEVGVVGGLGVGAPTYPRMLLGPSRTSQAMTSTVGTELCHGAVVPTSITPGSTRASPSFSTEGWERRRRNARLRLVHAVEEWTRGDLTPTLEATWLSRVHRNLETRPPLRRSSSSDGGTPACRRIATWGQGLAAFCVGRGVRCRWSTRDLRSP